MSIRLRLTLLYSVILALTLIGLSVALYLRLSSTTVHALKDRLSDQAKVLTSAAQLSPRGIALPPAPRDTLAQTRRLDGTISDKGQELVKYNLELPLDDVELQAVLTEGEWYSRELISNESIDNEPFLVYSKLVKVQEHPFGILQVARSLESQEQQLRTLRNSLIAGNSIVIIIAFGIGWVLAGAALRPINRITRTARAIGAERDFDRRVSYTGPQDEIGRLATTFNTMLTELQAAYRQVEHALQAQKRFVADASHELRTPLTTIRGNIALLQRRPPITEEDRVAVLGDMVDETDRVIRLVNDLLALARADAGRAPQREPVPIKPLIEDVCREARLLDPGRRIECDNLQDVMVAGNRDAIKQVLLILVDNAIKFTPREGPIALRLAVAEGNVAVDVRDAGPGIDPAALPHIFERFYRADSSRTGGGTGLGLAIAQTLAAAQAGTLTVRSEVGHGSVFTLTLPQAVDNQTRALDRADARVVAV
jgi:signal transduction histidine kinase